ncbi:hypothetical protein HGRIS_006604 [Hohenbuehelia grisea]|uniref:DUF6534 domain-containing protein n=1 Tax=Hohenbuehelia grisea TaxID=104357 RepID=A0ABR3JA09_9AGAR
MSIQVDEPGSRALDSLSLALFAHGTYTYLVSNFADLSKARDLVWSIASEPMVTSVISLTVHLFLAHRICQLNSAPGWTIIACIIVVLSFFPFAIGMYTTWFINSGSQALGNSVPHLRWVAIAGDISSATIDLTIAVILVYQLYRARTTIKSTQKMLNVISLHVISSGMITAYILCLYFLTGKLTSSSSAVQVSLLTAYFGSPNTLTFQIFIALASKAYVNTLMATLNLRDAVRHQHSPSTITVGAISSIRSYANRIINFNTSTYPPDTLGIQRNGTEGTHAHDIALAERFSESDKHASIV